MIIISSFQLANAVAAQPGPSCEITAKVLKIEKTSTHFDPMSYCRGREDFEYYRVILNISEITTYREATYPGTGSCDNMYMKNAEKSGQILHMQEYNKVPLSKGQEIKAIINYGGDECFGGFFLFQTQIVAANLTQKENTTDRNITTANEGKIKDIGSQYYIAPSVLILFALLYFFIKRK